MNLRITSKTAATLAVAFACVAASAQKSPPQKFSAKQIRAGAMLFAQNCAPCHGAHMADPEGAFDLRTLDRHRDAAVTSLIPALSCRSCRPNAPFAEFVQLSRTSMADETREEHRRRVFGDRP